MEEHRKVNVLGCVNACVQDAMANARQVRQMMEIVTTTLNEADADGDRSRCYMDLASGGLEEAIRIMDVGVLEGLEYAKNTLQRGTA